MEEIKALNDSAQEKERLSVLIDEGDVNTKRASMIVDVGRLFEMIRDGEQGVFDSFVAEGRVFPNVRNQLGETALVYAMRLGRREMVQEFLKVKEANIYARDKKGKDVMAVATERDDIHMMTYLFEQKGYDLDKSNYQMTLLMLAAENGHDAAVQLILDRPRTIFGMPAPQKALQYICKKSEQGGDSAFACNEEWACRECKTHRRKGSRATE